MKPLALVRSGQVLAAALLAVVLAGCGRGRDESRGVELVLGGPEPAPGMTFELRFDQVMARAGQIGEPTTDSPLVIVPAIAGRFTWLSARSGTFTPDEPLALDTRYQFSLRPGLTAADGRPVQAVLSRSLATPAFDLTGFAPSSPSTNAFSEPERLSGTGPARRQPDRPPGPGPPPNRRLGAAHRRPGPDMD